MKGKLKQKKFERGNESTRSRNDKICAEVRAPDEKLGAKRREREKTSKNDQLPAQTVAFSLCYQVVTAQTRTDRALVWTIESPDVSTGDWIYLDLGLSES